MDKYRIHIDNVTLQKNSVLILNNIQLELCSGHSYLLYGKNGAGKTSLMRCLVRMESEYQGEISIDPSENIAQIISFLPSTNILPDSLIVGDYLRSIRLLLDAKGLFDKELYEKTVAMFNIKSYQEKNFGSLSKGMAKMVFISITMMKKSDIIVLDEPFEGLDIAMKLELSELLMSEVKKGNLLLISSHEIAEIYKNFDQLIGIKGGGITSILNSENIVDYQEVINQIL